MRVMWSLFWRSVALLPFAALISLAVITACFAAVTLPLIAGIFLWADDWWPAAECAVAWVPAFLIARWFWRRESMLKEKRGVLL